MRGVPVPPQPTRPPGRPRSGTHRVAALPRAEPLGNSRIPMGSSSDGWGAPRLHGGASRRRSPAGSKAGRKEGGEGAARWRRPPRQRVPRAGAVPRRERQAGREGDGRTAAAACEALPTAERRRRGPGRAGRAPRPPPRALPPAASRGSLSPRVPLAPPWRAAVRRGGLASPRPGFARSLPGRGAARCPLPCFSRTAGGAGCPGRGPGAEGAEPPGC